MSGRVSGIAAMAGLIGLLFPAVAIAQQGRPDTTQMPCAAAHNLVQRVGGIVLRTGGHTYDRFVRDKGFCTPQEMTKPAFVPSRDDPQCFVGYTCEPFFPDDFDRD